MSRRLGSVLTGIVALAVVGATWAATARLPWLSETWIHLAVAAELDGLGAALALDRVPLRPLQHALVFAWQRTDASPAEARALCFALHLASVLLVAHLARALGCTGWRATVPPLLFLAFPSVKGLAWVDAVGGPGRVLGVLAALACLVRLHAARAAALLARPGSEPPGAPIRPSVDSAQNRGPTARESHCSGAPSSSSTGPATLVPRLGLVVSFVLALGFHQSAIVLPALVVLVLWGLEGAPLGRGLGRVVRRGLDWAPFAVIALGSVYLVYVGWLRAERYHGVVHPEAILANGAKAALSLAPEGLRLPAVEGLRGSAGEAGRILGALAVLVLAAVGLLGLLRGGPLVRALLLGAALDLVLPVLSTGFVLRYAVLAAALVALALGVVLERVGPRARKPLAIAVAALGVCWAADHLRDLREVRAAGRITASIVASAGAVRAEVGPGVPIFLVDAPDVWGREADVPLFNWGLPFALEAAGAPGPWRLLRTYPSRTGTDHVQITAETLGDVVARPEGPILVFDPAREELSRVHGEVDGR